MKMNSIFILWAIAAVIVITAGCISLGGDNTPSTVAASPTAAGQGAGNVNTVSPKAGGQDNTYVNTESLTDAQKAQATNAAKDNATVKEILNMPGYKVTGVAPGGAYYSTNAIGANTVIAVVSIEGGETKRSDGSLWTLDQYSVFVDVNKNSVFDIVHIEQKPLPTPKPK